MGKDKVKPKKCCLAYAEIIHEMNNCGESCVLLNLVSIRTGIRTRMAGYLKTLRAEGCDPEEPTEEQTEILYRYDECLMILNLVNKELKRED
jgi:hypothetical protein